MLCHPIGGLGEVLERDLKVMLRRNSWRIAEPGGNDVNWKIVGKFGLP